jgi:Trk K+ transport system NAD-binding subunit
VVVIALRSPDGEIVFNPKGDTTIDAGSVLVVVGRREHLVELEKSATGPRRHRPAT